MAAAIFFFIYYRFCFCLPHYTGSTGKEQGFAAPLRALALSRLRPFIMGVKNKIIATPTISIGSLSASVVHPREVFAEAIKYPCASIILVHNHPSGAPTPSREDIGVTEKLVKAGKVLDIPVLDHIIIGNKKYCSLKEKGNMG